MEGDKTLWVLQWVRDAKSLKTRDGPRAYYIVGPVRITMGAQRPPWTVDTHLPFELWSGGAGGREQS
jgi:hypothetical protein